ncbi:MAG: hypothetical protein AAB584_01860 [Patescibacteria group bacterium]
MNKTAILTLIVLGAAFGLIIWGNRQSGGEQDITKICIQHQNLRLHIHPRLKIIIKGQEQLIPANVGIASPSCFRPIHTHDGSGTLHIEFPKARDVRLGEFFLVWEKRFNSNQIFDYQNGAEGQLKMFVNGQENTEFENYIIKDLDEILIIYE